MALVSARAMYSRIGGMRSLLGCKQAVCPIQVATLRATYGEPYPYDKPYPYEKKKINFITEWFDSSTFRLNENSKVIIVDGNLAVGKNEFGRRLAKNFDLKFFPAVAEAEVYALDRHPNFDLRSLNQFLPERSQFYDLERFLKDPNPTSGRVGALQIRWYAKKFFRYANALEHLLNTGQGVVIVRSPFSDSVFAEAFRKSRYITSKFNVYYQDLVDSSLCEVLKPHISIYLDAPTNVVMDKIKKRNNANELNSKIITEEFVHTFDEIYKEKFLPLMRKSSEVVEVDWSEVADDMDMEALAEELQSLNLESTNADDTIFRDWYNLSEDMLCHYRKIFGDHWSMMQLVNRDAPWDCPEVLPHPDDDELYCKYVWDHPAVRYPPGWAPEFGHNTLFRL